MKTQMRKWGTLLILWLCVGVAGSSAQTQTKAPAKKAPAATPATFKRALLQPAMLKEKAPDVYEVKVTTTKGDFVIRVTREWAPLGADRFYNLVKNGFYDGASFFRVIPGFVVQFGLSAHPAVSQAWAAARIQDDPVKQSNKRGFVTYAMGGENTRTTQVFINLGDNTRLNPMGFAPFGEVIQGMEIVEQIYGGYGGEAPNGTGPAQDQISAKGKAYLEKEFPLLDGMKSAKIVAPAAPAAAPAKSPAKEPPKP